MLSEYLNQHDDDRPHYNDCLEEGVSTSLLKNIILSTNVLKIKPFVSKLEQNESQSLSECLSCLDLDKTFAAFIAVANLDATYDCALFSLERILSENSSYPAR